MIVTIPRELEPFIRRALSTGEYRFKDELVLDAVRTLRELKRRHRQLKNDIRHAIAQLDRGLGKPLDMKGIKAKARARMAGQDRKR
jgi:Arc/MetJ-type ribon-helix-helix transcriptional regulator